MGEASVDVCARRRTKESEGIGRDRKASEGIGRESEGRDSTFAKRKAKPNALRMMPTTMAMSKPNWGSSSPATTLTRKTAQIEPKEKRSYLHACARYGAELVDWGVRVGVDEGRCDRTGCARPRGSL